MDAGLAISLLTLFSLLSTRRNSFSYFRTGRHRSPDTICTIRAVGSQRPRSPCCWKHCGIIVHRDHIQIAQREGAVLFPEFGAIQVTLSADLRREFSGVGGFSAQNLW